MAKFKAWLEKTFKLQANKTNVKTEIMAGLVTFMAMAYILPVNAGMFADLGALNGTSGAMYNAVYVATALSAIIGTVLIGLLARLPLAQASGMGLNAFFVYTICGFGMSNGLTYANALVFILIDGIVFVLLTVTGLRKIIFNAIPKAVKVAIPAGIGLFIAFIGLQNAGIVVNDDATLVNLVSMNLLTNATYATLFPLFVVLAGIVAIAVLAHKNVKGAVLWGMLGAAVLYYVFALIGKLAGDETCEGIFAAISLDNPFKAFGDWGKLSIGKVFTEGFNFDLYLENHTTGELILVLITSSFSFCMVDMFDTMGTLYGSCARGNLLDKDGNVPNLDQAMLADAIATVTGAIFGTSTVTTYVESSAGIAEGGKTGLTSIVTAAMFLIALFLSPVVQLIPTFATAAALIYVGILMMNCVREIEWTAPKIAVPAFSTIAMCVLTYSISYGIGFGLLTYTLIEICSGTFFKNEEGKFSLNNIATLVISLLFVAMFLLTH